MKNHKNRLVDLPQEKSEIGMLSLLPAEVFLLPRSHRLPEPKPETKWEKFAKEKGITKKKRDRMVRSLYLKYSNLTNIPPNFYVFLFLLELDL